MNNGFLSTISVLFLLYGCADSKVAVIEHQYKSVKVGVRVDEVEFRQDGSLIAAGRMDYAGTGSGDYSMNLSCIQLTGRSRYKQDIYVDSIASVLREDLVLAQDGGHIPVYWVLYDVPPGESPLTEDWKLSLAEGCDFIVAE